MLRLISCFICGIFGWCESHHPVTKKVSNYTVDACIPCHRKIHKEGGKTDPKKVLDATIRHTKDDKNKEELNRRKENLE